MSTPFSNPWSNPNNPVDMYRRYKRRKAKRAAASAQVDHRNREVADNRAYEAQTQQTAAAFQNNQSRKVWNDPFASARQRPSGLWTPWDRPSANYDPTDW
jgi:hypothetical protein